MHHSLSSDATEEAAFPLAISGDNRCDIRNTTNKLSLLVKCNSTNGQESESNHAHQNYNDFWTFFRNHCSSSYPILTQTSHVNSSNTTLHNISYHSSNSANSFNYVTEQQMWTAPNNLICSERPFEAN